MAVYCVKRKGKGIPTARLMLFNLLTSKLHPADKTIKDTLLRTTFAMTNLLQTRNKEMMKKDLFKDTGSKLMLGSRIKMSTY